ncbi:diguanylate cyclase [uncultured Acetatifactor sp.]|uniref:GGDEF domain-containing protein n=1 Tax=uncultured Acetatifactor sp. TaxID=1671927 RepID=UPI0026114D9F|nr:GGDEF domain-containing protein [uncultured Acetatifactor sp.]MCI8695343.1 GGDEF domain-containing protein [Lachnospiraceae bacterium]
MTEEKKTGLPEEKNTGVLKGFRIQSLSLWLVAFTLIISVLIGIGIVQVMEDYYELAQRTREYVFAQEDARDLLFGSNYLTDQARLYAVTKDHVYAEAYFTEVHETRRRDLALEALEVHLRERNEDALNTSKEAMELSNALMVLEIHSMKLAALSAGEDMGSLAREIQDYQLTEEELSWTAQQQADASMELVFGEEYRTMKGQIEAKMSDVTRSVIEICERDQAESEGTMKNALIRQSIYTVLVVILVIFSYIMIAVLILRPIRIYVNCIKNNNFLEITGAYEFKYLAATYNNVYEMTMEQQNMLRKKAERDALTGLLNRQAFEQLKSQLRISSEPLAFLIIDVDVFKSINDNYGHDVGDQALIKVARLLDENFRKVDYVLRIGGDEFAVIMEKTGPDKKPIIRSKIEAINEILQHPEDEAVFPKYSVSVGIAFSEKGFYDDLFQQTDQALYHTKENGRCGYTFYDEL